MSASAETRILMVGDMHLGQRPTSLSPTILTSLPLAQLGPAHAWQRTVQTALDLKVHAVALAGDLVQGENAMFEAFGRLEPGIRKLSENGISVLAVAGNHDTRILPQLVQEIDGFHLLGPGGTWTTHTLRPGAGPAVRLAGWSFPRRHHGHSPLETAPPPADPNLPTLGLLHADLDASRSQYAPVSSTALRQCGYDGWFLGHIHLPGEVPPDDTPFYLGSLTPLNPKEQGLRGPVLVTVSGQGTISKKRLPLAPLRWEELTLDCQGMKNPQVELRAHLLAGINAFRTSRQDELDQVLALGLRLVLVGQVQRPQEFQQALAKLDPEDLILADSVFVQKITNLVRGSYDLQELSKSDHPAGILARQILLLENPGPQRSELLALARRTLDAVDAREAFGQLAATTAGKLVSDDALADQLQLIAHQSLGRLLDGLEVDHAAD